VKKALCYIQIGDIQKFKIEQIRAEETYHKMKTSDADIHAGED
jgi:hypothetical protein